MYKVYINGNYLFIEDSVTPDINKMNPRKNVYVERDGLIFNFYKEARDLKIITLLFSEILNEAGNPYTDIDEFIDFVVKKTGSNNNYTDGGLDVVLQDATTPPFDLFFVEALGPPTTLTVEPVKNDYTITVASTANFAVGTWLGLFSGVAANKRYFWAEVLAINGLVLTLDSPMDFEFIVGSPVLPTNRNMAVDGSVTPRIFSIQTGTAGLEIDIVRLMLPIVCESPPELGEFGDQPALTRGLLIRKVDGEYRNYLNFKTNYEIGLHTFDLNIYEQVKVQDFNAVMARYTLGGQSKHGVVIRLEAGDELQAIVQDDLTGLNIFLVMAEGSEVSND